MNDKLNKVDYASRMSPLHESRSGGRWGVAAFLSAGLLVLGACSSSSTDVAPSRGASGAGVDAAWTQYGGDGQLSARVVTRGPSCPTIETTGGSGSAQPVEMFLRAQPEGSGNAVFDDRVCEAPIPAGTSSASVAGLDLPLPVSDPTRIVVLGDTGCRLKKGRPPQPCNDPSKWPAAKIARLAAAEKPQLVIHMGDEHYREAPCPDTPEGAGCKGSPWGYNAASNRADFFEPEAPLLAAAPWVFIRGDHEGCPRNGVGWFRYWDARGNLPVCTDYTEPFKVQVGSRSLLVFDDSAAEEKFPIKDQKQQKIYKQQLAQIEALATGSSWFATHKPLWGIKPGTTADAFERTNPAMQTATGNKLPKNVVLSMAGDLHLFEAFTFEKQPVPQIVIGNGGDLLADGPPPSPLPGLALPEGVDKIRTGTIVQNFGYTVWEQNSSGTWTVTLKNQDGATTLACEVSEKPATATCG